MRRLNPMVIFATAAILAALLVIYVFSGGSGGNADRLTDKQAAAPRPKSAEQDCLSQQTSDLIKRELFRRAAQIRGSDQAAFDQLAANSALRIDSADSTAREDDVGTFSCSANVTLALPPGVAVIGGRRSLVSDVDYAVQPSADGSGNVLTLQNADGIITPLATLVRSGAAPAEPVPPTADNDASFERAPTAVPAPAPSVTPSAAAARPPVERSPPPRTTAPAPPRQAPAPTPPRPAASSPPQATASPSFNCRSARTQSEIAVCQNADLASLDRQMAAQFNSAMSRGTPEQRALLQRTRSRFLSHRNSCRTNACITDAYSGRMREISDITGGRWKPY